MQGVTIEVFPVYNDLSNGFRAAASGPVASRRAQFIYQGTTFRLDYDETDDGQLKNVKAVLNGIDTPLPTVFQHELKVNLVVLRCRIPDKLNARIGWYVGENFGLPDAACCVDPHGEHNQGQPQLYANGTNYANVVNLFRRVMTGMLQPGCERNIWSGRIYDRII